MITCTATHSVELLLGTPARRLCRNVNAGHSFTSNFSRHTPPLGHWSWPTVTANLRHANRPRYAHTNAQGPPVWSQDNGSGAGSSPGTFAYYYDALDPLLNALRQGDTLKMYFCLIRFVSHDNDIGSSCFTEVVASIPAITFSEILRCFDPFNVAKEIDTAPGINISYGAAIHTPLGELINKWGVKLLYVRILNRLHRMQQARRNARIRPLLNDYVILMKCAAATSDIRAVKDIWNSMKEDGYSHWRHSEAFTEFVKASYLSEKLYANNDLARFRLRPLDMHRSSLKLPKGQQFRLLNLRSNITRFQRHRFGENMSEPYFAEPLTRLQRKRNPLRKLERRARRRGMLPGCEKALCAFMKANGRNGRLKASNYLLKMYCGIVIQRDKASGTIEVGRGFAHPPGSPRAPTEHLLDAVVHCYCCMGEVIMAVKLVDFISRQFSIPVPDKVWSDLLQYARIMQTKPTANEWAIAHFHQKVVRADTVLDIWDLCTQEPYNFQPGLQDYHNLIKSLIRKSGSMKKPIEALRQVKPLYDDAVRACEEAWCELLQTTMQQVPNHAAYRKYRRLKARKDYAWYCFHYSSCEILNMILPGRVDDHGGVREIPNLVSEFRHFMPRQIRYHIATGYVEFASDNPFRRNLVEEHQVVEDPKPLYERSPFGKSQRGQEEWIENRGNVKNRGEVEEDYALIIRDGMQVEDVDADGCEDIREVSTSQQEGEDIASKLGQETSTDKDGVDGDGWPSPSYWDLDDTPSFSTDRWVIDTQVVEKPAYRYRPRYSGPSSKVSMKSIRKDGGEFTGYHDDHTRSHFAAHLVARTTIRVAGVPIDLGLGSVSRNGTAAQKDPPDMVRMAERFL
ncbi:hypothetical protein VP1G_10162 [Cytospora mali]|uniref:Uncharacterized protein n=1 Tax=Cytospora mali TaxID=578113 RepID=A0A194VGM8_CYTMA|nr:hypothetical protein VP1G_10162 [Valsa mali var. pyri (nom. inval.)]